MNKHQQETLLKRVEEAEAEARRQIQKSGALTGEIAGAKKEVEDIRAQFNDLKTRLLAAERSNEFMRGYLARVQEDDRVREELVTTGDPDGEQTLVPKRKATDFLRPSDFSHFKERDDSLYGYVDRQRAKPPKHWVTY